MKRGGDMARSVDLEEMGLEELLEHQRIVEGLIKQRREAERENIVAKIREMAERANISVNELRKMMAPSSVRVAGERPPPKYRNPTNPEITWSGRGGVPGWIKDYETKGKNRDDLLIDRG